MKTYLLALGCYAFLLTSCSTNIKDSEPSSLRFVEIKDVKVNDPFWSPKLRQFHIMLWETAKQGANIKCGYRKNSFLGC